MRKTWIIQQKGKRFMAKIEFVEGVQCKQCGEIACSNRLGARISIFTSEICQNCGAHIMDMDITARKYNTTEDGRAVIIKITKGFLSEIYEVAREIE